MILNMARMFSTATNAVTSTHCMLQTYVYELRNLRLATRTLLLLCFYLWGAESPLTALALLGLLVRSGQVEFVFALNLNRLRNSRPEPNPFIK